MPAFPTPGPSGGVDAIDCTGITCVAAGTLAPATPALWWSGTDGRTFVRSVAPLPPSAFLQSVACQVSTCVALGIADGGREPIALVSTNGGRNFSPIQLPEGPGGDDLACSHTLCLLAEQPSYQGGEEPVLIAPGPRGPWRTLPLALVPAVRPGAATTNVLSSSGLVACSARSSCLVANVTRSIMGPLGLAHVWSLAASSAEPVTVSSGALATQVGLPTLVTCGVSTCGVLVPMGARDTLTLVGPTGMHSITLPVLPTASPSLVSCTHDGCLLATVTAKGAPARLTWASSSGVMPIENPLPSWVPLGVAPASRVAPHTLLVAVPASGGVTAPQLLRLAITGSAIVARGLVTLPND